MQRLIVSGADAGYFDMVQDLISSILRTPDIAGIRIAVIDGGLTDAQRKSLAASKVLVSPPYLPEYAPKRALAKRPNLAINLSKPWLNKLFPEAETILWLDGDTWVQDVTALDVLFGAASGGYLAVVPQAGAYWIDQVPLRWIFPGFAQVRSFLYKNGRHARLPYRVMRNIASKAALNAGVFALEGTALHWAAMQAWQKILLRRGKPFTADQMSLSLSIYEDGLPVNLLPQRFNYMGPWRVNTDTQELVEYYYPYPPVGVVHLADQKKCRADTWHKVEMPDIHGRIQDVRLRYCEPGERVQPCSLPSPSARNEAASKLVEVNG